MAATLTGSATTIGDFIAAAWDAHADDAAGVAARLADGLVLLDRDLEQGAAFVALAEHVLVGHLADGAALLQMVQQLAGAASDRPALATALARAGHAAGLLRGAADAPAGLDLANQVRAHGSAALGLAARHDGAAAQALMDAAARVAAAAGPGDAEPHKALAAGWNNLAAQLQEQPRSAAEDTLMMEAARQSRLHWSRAGTWLQVERADWRLAKCAASLGDAAQALRHAQSCLAICEANDADAFERFFAHEAIGTASSLQRDTAAARTELARLSALLAQIDPADQAYCQACIDTLTRTLVA